MGDESSDTMNLDLNLGPISVVEPEPEPGSGSIPSETVSLDELMDETAQTIREAVRLGVRQQRWRWRQVHISPETRNVSMELNQLMGDSGNGGSLHAGEGSVTAEERIVDVSKACENNNGFLENDDSEKKVDMEKGSGNDGAFFNCNICFDLAKDPVVTSCGHLFCWPCIYRWLNVFSDAKECPVCKGEVTIKNLTPIYGQGSNAHEPEDDSDLKIPVRPHARRVESLRQTIQRTTLTLPVEEVIRRLGSRIDLSRILIAQQDADSTRGAPERIFTSPAMRIEQSHILPRDNIVDLTLSGTETSGAHRFHSELFRRSLSHRGAIHPPLTSTMSPAERIFDSYIRSPPIGRIREQALPVDDRDSVSSIAAVINSESQTVDTAVEIDSMVSLSTSSSRRRNDASRVSDVDSGDSRAPRRRRLH